MSSSPTLDQARAAKSKALTMLQDASTVVGVGIARRNGGYCVKVNVSHAPAAAEAVPETIDGVPVRVEVVGVLRKRPARIAAPSANRMPRRAGRK
jgi:hypothetical protein